MGGFVIFRGDQSSPAMLSWAMTDFIDFKTLERPKSPNTYLLAPAELCEKAKPDRGSVRYSATPKTVFAACMSAIEAQKSWTLAGADEAAGRLQFISTSALMRYKDDVDILLVPAANTPDTVELAIYSRSRVGYSDLGANAKRVGALLDALSQQGLST